MIRPTHTQTLWHTNTCSLERLHTVAKAIIFDICQLMISRARSAWAFRAVKWPPPVVEPSDEAENKKWPLSAIASPVTSWLLDHHHDHQHRHGEINVKWLVYRHRVVSASLALALHLGQQQIWTPNSARASSNLEHFSFSCLKNQTLIIFETIETLGRISGLRI